MRKLSKKLLLSILSVALVFIALGTTTFAWFSMNSVVTAEDMKVKIKSDSTYLLISNTNNTADAIQAENSGKGFTSVSFTADAAAELYPTAHGTVGGSPEYVVTPITPGAGVTSFSWYYMTGTDAATSTGKAQSARQIATDDVNKYVLSYTFYFTLADGSNPVTDLKVSSCSISGDTAVRCLVVGASSVEFEATDSDGDATVLAATLTSTTVATVTVFIFYDGNASNIYTNNIPSIANTEVDLTFSVTAAA